MSLTVYYVCKKPSRRRLSITTGTRDKIYVLPPYFYLYLEIKTSLGSNKPSPVTGLAVFPYYNFGKTTREGSFSKNPAGLHHPPALCEDFLLEK